MGLFSKNPKKYKIYTLAEAMSFVKANKGYSVIQEERGYRVIPDSVANEHIDRYRSQLSRRKEFTKELQLGYTPRQATASESSNYMYRYGYNEEER